MAAERWLALAILAVCALPSDLFAAELPSQNKKTKPVEAVRRCDIAGSPGVCGERRLREDQRLRFGRLQRRPAEISESAA